MSLIVGRIADKFWNNGSFKQPNGFPVYEEYKEFKDLEPSLSSFMSGIIYLFGDHWNHCKWKDGYYSLQIMLVLDEDKKYYLYRMERELWFDVLKYRASVTGDLSNSNDDKLLEQHLSKTFGILDNPAKITTINFKEFDADWRKDFKFESSKKDIPQVVLSKTSLDSFLRAVKGEFVKNWLEVDKKIFSGEQNPAVYILSVLHPSITLNGWKHRLREKINRFIESIKGDEGQNLKIAKITEPTYSKMVGRYCITQKVDGISQGEENLDLEKIDLSGLTDIIPINFYDEREIEPHTPLGKGSSETSGIFDSVDSVEIPLDFIAKLRRRPYLPICGGDKAPESPKTTFGFNNKKFNWNYVRSPQEIIFLDEGKEKKANLWYIDNLNFIVGFIYNGDWFDGIHTITGGGAASHIYYSYDRHGAASLINTEPIWPYASSEKPFKLLNKSLFRFGFSIFGQKRSSRDWKLFQYLREDNLSSVEIFNGIKKDFLKKYKSKGFWWSDINDNLKKIQPSEEFTKFYLDNYFFTWLAFFPYTEYWSDTKPYLNEDYWGTWVHTNYNYYVQDALSSDIYDKNRKWVLLNPFNEERFVPYMDKVDDTLNKLLLTEKVNFPKGFEVAKGDYFFSNKEYEIVEFRQRGTGSNLKQIVDEFWNSSKYYSHGKGLDVAAQAVFRVEDFGTFIDERDFPLDEHKKFVVLCTTIEGNLEIRGLESFNAVIELNQASSQIVQSVDGATEEKLLFTRLQKLSDPLLSEAKKDLDSGDIKRALYAFYKMHGYKTKIVGDEAHWNWFSDSDFSDVNAQPVLFKLVGTEWFCYIKHGKISLITENEKNFGTKKTKTHKLNHEENPESKNFSLIEKINQKVRFQFFTIPYYLSWKTTFSNNDSISLYFESADPTILQTEYNGWFVKLDTGFDVIWYEHLKIPKKRSRADTISNDIELEKLNLDLVRDQYKYQIDEKRYELAQKRYQESIRRAEQDLYNHKVQSVLTLGASSLGAATGLAAQIRNAPPVYKYRDQTILKTRDRSFWQRGPEGPSSFSTFIEIPAVYETKKIKYKDRWANVPPMFGTFLGGAAAAAVSNLAYRWGYQFPEIQRRIDADKQINAEELANQSLVMDTNHMDRQIKAQLGINQLTNTYDNPAINERIIFDNFRNKTEWHGKKLGDAYLVVYTPSDIQLKYLQSHKDEFGVMCDIPNIEYNFFDGMPGDIIRFRNLDQKAILNLPNLWIREYLQAKLLAGVHIVPVTETAYKLLSADEYRKRVLKLNNDLFEKSEEIKDKDLKVTQLTNWITTIEKETEERVKAETQEEKDNLRNRIVELENEVNNVNTALKAKLAKCEEEKDELNKDKEKLNRQIEDLEKAKRNLEGDKFTLSNKVIEQKNKLVECENRKDYYEKQIEKLKKDAADTEEKTRQGIIATEKAFQERVNGLNKQIEQLKNERKEVDSQITAKTNEIDSLKAKLAKAEEAAKQANPTYGINVCTLLKDLSISANYNLDVQTRENGFSAFTDLCFELADNLKWIRNSDIQRHIAKYEGINKFFETLGELEKIPVIDKCEDVVSEPGWGKFVEWMEKGGDKNGEVDKVIALTNEIKSDYSTPPNVHAVKLIMDELNYQANVLQTNLAEQIKQDESLDHFFKHFYPGQNSKRLYQQLYKVKPELAIAQRKYLATQCVAAGEGEDPISFLDRKIKETTLKVPTAPTGTEKTPPIYAYYGCNKLDGERITFYWFPKVFYSTPSDCGGTIDDRSLALVRYCYKKGTYYRGNAYYHWVGVLMWEAKAKDRGSGNAPLASQTEKGLVFGRYDGWFDAISKERDREIYIRNYYTYHKSEAGDLFKKLFEKLNLAWSQREKIIPDQQTKNLLDAGQLILYPYIFNTSLTNKCKDLNYWRTLNLSKTFGKEKALDAWRLLIILSSVKTGFVKKGVYDNLKTWELNLYWNDAEAISKNWKPNTTIKIENWFADFHSLLNFLYRYVVLNKPITRWQEFISDKQSTREGKEIEQVLKEIYS